MATYTQADMAGNGASGEILNVAQTYTFTFSTPSFVSQSVYGGDAYFILNSLRSDNTDLSGTYDNVLSGPLPQLFKNKSEKDNVIINL